MTAEEELGKLKAAVLAAGFGIMQTSGAWSIHDVSQKAKVLEDDDLKRATYTTELEIAIVRLWEALNYCTNWIGRCETNKGWKTHEYIGGTTVLNDFRKLKGAVR